MAWPAKDLATYAQVSRTAHVRGDLTPQTCPPPHVHCDTYTQGLTFPRLGYSTPAVALLGASFLLSLWESQLPACPCPLESHAGACGEQVLPCTHTWSWL